MDAIRQALGEDTISYFGFSYGSELGATWATLFPDTVRAAVLDGAANPAAGTVESKLEQLTGFEDTFTTYLAQCSADDDCLFHNDGDAEGAFDALMAELDETPIPSVAGRPDVDAWRRHQGGRPGDVLRQRPGPRSPRLWPRPRRVTAPASSPSSTGTTSDGPTARGATSWRRTSRSTA